MPEPESRRAHPWHANHAVACKKFLPEFAKRLEVWRSWTNAGVMRPPPTLHEFFMEVMKEKWFFQSEWGTAWIREEGCTATQLRKLLCLK